MKGYLHFLIISNLHKPENYFNVLREFRNIYYELDMDRELQDFALLYWAKDDLQYQNYQHYWDGATRENIDTIIKDKFVILKKQFEAEG